jgi:signal transduction histidine kinase
MRIAVEHAGAEQGLLILLRDDKPQIEAAAAIIHGPVEVSVRQTVIAPLDLPKSVLQYVFRTREKEVDRARELAIQSRRGEGEPLLVSVSDTGVGLPPQHADQIFNAFVTTKPHGTGLGLRISRSIVESHGGRLWAAANSPHGAHFYFMLPTSN